MEPLSNKQHFISMINKRMANNQYIVNKIGKNQQRFFKCLCCGKEFDFNNSADYVGAVAQWEEGGGKCYVCANMLGTKERFPCHFK